MPSLRWRIAGGLSLIATLALVAALIVTSGAGGEDDATTPTDTVLPAQPPPAGPVDLTARISSRPVGRPIPAGFLGLSIEYQAVRAYTGRDAAHPNPVLLALIRNLSGGQAPVLRIGGDSTDVSYVPAPGLAAPPNLSYRLTPGWLSMVAGLARTLGARMTMGLNLGADDPRLAGAEARAFERALGGSLTALEIGNEPNVYSKIAIYKNPQGQWLHARGPGFGFGEFARQFAAEAAAAPGRALAGPALAAGPTPNPGSWVAQMPSFLARQPRVETFTLHRYPLRNCYVPPSSPQYPSVAHLLSSYATAGLAHSLIRWIAIAHDAHRRLRVDELNSVACRGRPGVSDTFASSLWALDALFSLARAGVDGVNFHTLPRSAYQLFAFSHSAGRWSARVEPVYYGLQLFAQAAPAGSRLLRVTGTSIPSRVSVWATRGPDRRLRAVLVNESPTRSRTIALRPPSGSAGPATIERLLAPGVHARGGVTLGGRSYGTRTYTGQLGGAILRTLTPSGGAYRLTLPRGSAALVTFG